MKTKIKLVALVAGLLAFLPMTSAWAYDTFYAELVAKVSTSQSGAGLVYVDGSGSSASAAESSAKQSSGSASATMSFTATAEPAAGYEFDHWAESDGGASVSESNPGTFSVNCASTKDKTNTKTVFAVFKEGTYDPYGVIFEKPDYGSYAVKGKIGPSGTSEVKIVAASDAGNTSFAGLTKMFIAENVSVNLNGGVMLGWYTRESEGSPKQYFSTENSFSRNFSANAIIGVDICDPNDLVDDFSDYAGLVAALASDAKVIVIQQGVDIDANGGAVTVPAGKKLVINGALRNVKFDCLGSYEANGTLTKVVAMVGTAVYMSISEAVTAWVAGQTLTLCDNATLSDVIKINSNEKRTLNLSRFILTAANKKDAIEIVNKEQSTASSCLDVIADATNPGGISASGGSCFRYNASSATKDRPIIHIKGGIFRGSYGVRISSPGNTRCPQFYFDGGEFITTSYDVNNSKALLVFNGSTFNGTMYLTSDTNGYIQFSKGKFKTLPSHQDNAAYGTDKWRTAFKEALKTSDGYYQLLTAAPAQFAAKAAWSKSGYPTDSGCLYYENADEAFASGQMNITLGPNTHVKKDVKGAYIIDASAENTRFSGNVTLTTQNEKFTLVLSANGVYDGVVTPYDGKELSTTRTIQDDGKIKYEFSTLGNPVPQAEAEASVDGKYYRTFYDATYAVDGTKDKTIKLEKDIANAVFVSRGANASNDGITRVTVDFNGKQMTLDDVQFSGGANYYVTFIDSSAEKTGEFTNNESALQSIGLSHYLDGSYADYGNLILYAQGGTWHADPTNQNIADGKVRIQVPAGYVVTTPATSRWKVMVMQEIVEVSVGAEDEETKVAIEVDEELKKRAEEEKTTVAEVLNTVEDNGLKVWENRALNDASTVVSKQEVVREVKNEQGEMVEEKVVAPTSDLPTGIYVEKTTIEVKNTDGETVQHTVEVKTARVQNDASADSVMVAVAGDTTKDNQPLTVANVVADAAKGDVIQVYDKTTGIYRQWKYDESGNWVGELTASGSDTIEAGDPEKCQLEAGEVFWYKRADKSDKSAITTVAVPKENIEVKVEQGKADEKAWTMVPNLNFSVNDKGEAEGLNLDEVKDDQGEKPFAADQVIVPTEGMNQRTYTFKNNKWGYNETKSITIGGRTLPQTKRIENGKLPANKNFWWVSGGGKPKIILNESKK